MSERTRLIFTLILVCSVAVVLFVSADLMTVTGLSVGQAAFLVFSTLALGLFSFTGTDGKRSRILLLVVLLLWAFLFFVLWVP